MRAPDTDVKGTPLSGSVLGPKYRAPDADDKGTPFLESLRNVLG